MAYQRANDRDVNRMSAGVDFDAVRFQLTAGGTGIVDRLAAMLCAPDGMCWRHRNASVAYCLRLLRSQTPCDKQS